MLNNLFGKDKDKEKEEEEKRGMAEGIRPEATRFWLWGARMAEKNAELDRAARGPPKMRRLAPPLGREALHGRPLQQVA